MRHLVPNLPSLATESSAVRYQLKKGDSTAFALFCKPLILRRLMFHHQSSPGCDGETALMKYCSILMLTISAYYQMKFNVSALTDTNYFSSYCCCYVVSGISHGEVSLVISVGENKLKFFFISPPVD